MTHHDHFRHPWRLALAVGTALGLWLSSTALAQVPAQLPANLVPLTTFTINSKASGSETNQTSTADYTAKFTLAPNVALDPPALDTLLRIETDPQAPEPCGDVFIPAGCFVPSAGGFVVADAAGCGVRVVAFKDEINYFKDLTPLLQTFSATLQQVQGEWQARLTTAFTEAVAQPEPCFITFTVGTNGVENVPISRSDAKFRAAQ